MEHDSLLVSLFEAALNGRPVGEDVLSPGWSAYEWRLRYQPYDVGPQLEAQNVLTVAVGNGWYRGRLGHPHALDRSAMTVAA